VLFPASAALWIALLSLLALSLPLLLSWHLNRYQTIPIFTDILDPVGLDLSEFLLIHHFTV
jgi:hypothetical protein